MNFPAGGEDSARAADDAAEAVRDGAGEIDLVLPYRAFLRGEETVARDCIEAVRETCPDSLLKVILETGELGDAGTIRAAADLALAAGPTSSRHRRARRRFRRRPRRRASCSMRCWPPGGLPG